VPCSPLAERWLHAHAAQRRIPHERSEWETTKLTCHFGAQRKSGQVKRLVRLLMGDVSIYSRIFFKIIDNSLNQLMVIFESA